jgi:hydroxyethylthiazole kinase
MTIAPGEIAAFVQRSDALLINLGTCDAERRKAATKAVTAAYASGIPWVLDPTFIDRSRSRATFARALLAKAPRAVRLNEAEFQALAGAKAGPVALARLAASRRTVVGLTGEHDLVHDGKRLASIGNGDPLMARVTAMGCAGSALVAAALAVEPDGWRAVAAVLIAFGVAGEIAASRARGPGSFAIEIIDALYRLDRGMLLRRAKVR